MYVRMFHIYVPGKNKFCIKSKRVLFDKKRLFQNKEKGAICQMVLFVIQYCIVAIILVNAEGTFHPTIRCYMTHSTFCCKFDSK